MTNPYLMSYLFLCIEVLNNPLNCKSLRFLKQFVDIIQFVATTYGFGEIMGKGAFPNDEKWLRIISLNKNGSRYKFQRMQSIKINIDFCWHFRAEDEFIGLWGLRTTHVIGKNKHGFIKNKWCPPTPILFFGCIL